jgi:hypothetical protein
MSSPSTSGSATFSVKAITSFLLGGLAVGAGLVAVALDLPTLMVVMLASIVLSVLLGALARRQVRQSEGRLRGAGLARWGIGLGVVGIGFALLLPAR